MNDKTALAIGSTLFVLGGVSLFLFGEKHKRAQLAELNEDLRELKKRVDALEGRPTE